MKNRTSYLKQLQPKFIKFQFLCIATLAIPFGVVASPIVVTYSDFTQDAVGSTVSGNTDVEFRKEPCTQPCPVEIGYGIPPAPQPRLSVPGFDSSLGQLLYAELAMNGYMSSKILDHAGFQAKVAIPVQAGHNASVRANLSLENDGQLRQILSASDDSDFIAGPFFQGYDLWNGSDNGKRTKQICVLNVCQNIQVQEQPYVEYKEKQDNEFHFAQTFSGSSLGMFQGDDLEIFKGSSKNILDWNGYHTQGLLGGTIAAFLELPSGEQNGSAGGVPGKGSAALLAARIFNEVVANQTGHPISYSDMHFAAAFQMDMTVTYTYEPTVSVSESPTWALFLLGFLGLSSRSIRSKNM